MTKERIKVLLDESRLPEVVITECFREQLHESNSEVEAKALIERRQKLVEEMKQKANEKRNYPVDDDKPSDEELIKFAESF